MPFGMRSRNSSDPGPWQAYPAAIGRWSWLFLCGLMPISGDWITIPLVVAVAALLLSRIGRPFNPDWGILWPLFLFYGLHVLGMAWSTDIDFGLFDLQIKLGLVLLPLAATGFRADQGGSAMRQSMVAFSAGTMVAIMLGLGKALACFGQHGWIECFTQSYLSYDLHPSYAAWYTVWAILYWVHALATGTVPARWVPPVLAFLFFALSFSVMLASKSGLIGLLLVLVVAVLLILRNLTGGARWLAFGALAFSVALPGWLLSSVIMARTTAAVKAVERVSDERPGEEAATVDGNDERLAAWTCSWSLIKENPAGAGTGDIKHALVGCYETMGAREAAERRLNSHSQFLQGGVALGWAGLLSAVLLAVVPLWQALRRRDLLLGVFVLLFMLNAAIESVLEVQAGVVFFALFPALMARDRSLSVEPTPRP